MAIRMTKPWQALDAEQVAKIASHIGVYQLADSAGEVVYIGYAGGASPFGLRGCLQDHLKETTPPGVKFRIEITTTYHSRFRELVQVYLTDHGCLPVGNPDLDLAAFGRVRPAAN